FRRRSNTSGLPIVGLLWRTGQGSGEVAAGGPRLASDQRGAFVERVAVLVVERHHGALLRGQVAVAAVEIQVGVRSRLPVHIAGFGKPESREQAASRANGAADADL